jgi:hypothetical protein
LPRFVIKCKKAITSEYYGKLTDPFMGVPAFDDKHILLHIQMQERYLLWLLFKGVPHHHRRSPGFFRLRISVFNLHP